MAVDGDPHYDARTTRRALQFLLSESGTRFGRLRLDMRTGVPIGAGFGASAASAISAVLAVSRTLGIKKPLRELALCAHRAEILEKTGLGTVSVVYKATGAGAITEPGEPGEAKFVKVRVPKGTRLVTAFLSTYDKKKAISSEAVSNRVNLAGRRALKNVVSRPTLDGLGAAGEWFARRVGLASPEVLTLEEVAKSAGASHASQNMIGQAIHSIASDATAGAVARALRSSSLNPRVDVFEVGSVPAGIL